MMVASLVLGVPAGILADRVGPGRGLALGAWSRLLVIAAALIALHSPALAIAIAFAYSAASQLFSSAELALIRVLDEQRPARGHAVLVVLQYAGQGAGLFLLAPGLYVLGGAAAMVLGAVALYVVVGGLTLAILRAGGNGLCVAPRERTSASLRPTLNFFATDAPAAYAAGLLAFFELALKAMAVAIPIFLIQELDLTRVQLALLAIPALAGAAAGFWVAGQLRPEQATNLMRPLFAAIAAMAAGLAIVSQGLPLPGGAEIGLAGMVPVGAGLGLCLSLAPITARAVLTHRAPVEHQARVFATEGVLSNVIVIIPLALAGVGTEVMGTVTTFLFLAVVGAAMLVTLEYGLPRLRGRLPEPEPVPIRID